MPLDGKILAAARDELQNRRKQRDAAHASRRTDVFRHVPALADIDAALAQTMLRTVEIALGNTKNPDAHLAEIERENTALQAQAKALLAQNGYPADYLDETPACNICDDTGRNGLAPCACLMELYRTLKARELSSLLDMENATFDAIKLSYYDDTPGAGITARDNMAETVAICKAYAENFSQTSPNLFFTGDTGLGKTLLSSCIAKQVSERGFSVVYETAGNLFARFEEEKFQKGEDVASAQSDVRRYLNCDLLILDDLGTEMTTSFVQSALYTLINTRLKKQTIISTNFSLKKLEEKYTPQILSRLEGEYEILTFFGKDIRKLKKGL